MGREEEDWGVKWWNRAEFNREAARDIEVDRLKNGMLPIPSRQDCEIKRGAILLQSQKRKNLNGNYFYRCVNH